MTLTIRSKAVLFVAVVSAYTLFNRAALNSVDEAFIYRTTESIIKRQSLVIEPIGDRDVSRFSVLPSLLLAPFYGIADLSIAAGPNREQWLYFCTSIGAASISALTVVMLASWLSHLGHTTPVAVTTALLYAFGSLAFAYSSTLFIQVPTTLLLVCSCMFVSLGHWRAATASIALLVWCRLNLVLLIPGLLLGVYDAERQSFRKALVSIVVGSAIGLAAALANNIIRGDEAAAGAYSGEAFSTPLWVGMVGQLFSIGKGIIWYAPLCTVGIFASVWYAKARPNPGRMIAYVLAIYLIMIAKWWTWHGGMILGPRLLLPILPLCMMPIAEWLNQWATRPNIARKLFVCLSLCSLVAGIWFAAHSLADFAPTGVSETESANIPQLSPFANIARPVSIWLWNVPSSTVKAVAIAICVGLLIGSWLMLRPMLQIYRPPISMIRVPGLIGLLVLFAHIPQLSALLSGMGNNQYRNLSAIGGTRSGTLIVPLSGHYTFIDWSQSLDVRIDGRPIFTGRSFAALELEAGNHSISVYSRNGGEPARLHWVTPGWGYYKNPIPADYFVSTNPTFWERIRVFWRHFAWLFVGVPAGILFTRWLASDSALTNVASH